MQIDKKLLRSFLSLASALEAKDEYTGGHLWRVSQFARMIGEKIGFSKEELFSVSIGGFLHDLGKILMPDSILFKRDELDASEYEIIRTHAKIGSDLIAEHPLSVLASDVILHHHENFNGTGYPDQLFETEIQLNTRIVGIADAFDAMTSTRPYRKGIDLDKAFSILEREKDRQFDGKLVERFLQIPREKILAVVSHSEPGIPLLVCSYCATPIVVQKKDEDGDSISCRACGRKHRIHKYQDSIELESLNNFANTNERIPKLEMSAIEFIVQDAPSKVYIGDYGYQR
ncbi:MAG: HD-GYP domain-containing protein [Leptospiraceae bacterium]|nr:HD-GYP domain-containing protein [Leptospiraceae bacterium]